MSIIERLAVEQAVYNAIGRDLKTGVAHNLRGEATAYYLDQYEHTGATGFDVRVCGRKVGTFGFDRVKGAPARTTTELRVTDRDALVAYEDPDFDAYCARWLLDHIDAVAADYVRETGDVPDGMDWVEVEEPAVPDGIKPGGRLRVDPEKVAEALGPALPGTLAGLLGGGDAS